MGITAVPVGTTLQATSCFSRMQPRGLSPQQGFDEADGAAGVFAVAVGADFVGVLLGDGSAAGAP